MDNGGVEVGKITLTGGKAAAALAVLAVIVVVRIFSMGGEVTDKKLIKNLEVQIMCDYMPGEAAALKAAVESGDEARISSIADSVTTAKIDIESVQVRHPLLAFSSSRDAVVKVTYSLKDSKGTRGRKTNYYRYTYSSLLKHWSYEYETSKLGYLLSIL